ncbi:MAG TPA: plastocyanin/azurin family copper-binding protein [Gemmatimonadales bacterium]|jgi:plastocyanin|nr:plastocyanin/azurin family copper-binding protein [Gemmatimonadales bacterium]
MTVTKLAAVLALGALACGGEKPQAQPEQAPAAQEQAAPAGPVVEVQMTGTTTAPVFEPAALTIAPGTTVRFINVAAGPHNISFWGDSIPAGAAAVLNAAMAGRTMGDLAGMMVTQPNETFDVSFAGAPTGLYKGYCLPHLALGMTIDITVQ